VKTNSRLTSQDIPTQTFIAVFKKGPQFALSSARWNPISHFLKIHFDTILPSTTWSPN